MSAYHVQSYITEEECAPDDSRLTILTAHAPIQIEAVQPAPRPIKEFARVRLVPCARGGGMMEVHVDC